MFGLTQIYRDIMAINAITIITATAMKEEKNGIKNHFFIVAFIEIILKFINHSICEYTLHTHVKKRRKSKKRW